MLLRELHVTLWEDSDMLAHVFHPPPLSCDRVLTC
jgi:hypothetical protein